MKSVELTKTVHDIGHVYPKGARALVEWTGVLKSNGRQIIALTVPGHGFTSVYADSDAFAEVANG